MKIIKLSDLENNLPNIENHHKKLKDDKLRNHTYLSTYPVITNFPLNSKLDDVQIFKMLALMTYAWMPRILRIDGKHLKSAVFELSKAREITNNNYKEIDIQAIGNCLHSLVGASKMLHFINPEVFPIWDSRIQSIISDNKDMYKSDNYYDYVDQVYSLMRNKNFHLFYEKYNQANRKRLEIIKIKPYDVTRIRAIEASIFEMT